MNRCVRRMPQLVVLVSLFMVDLAFGAPLDGAEPVSGQCLPSCTTLSELMGPATQVELRALADLIGASVQSAPTGAEKIEILNRFFFDGLRFETEDSPLSQEQLLPDAVLQHRRGACVGLAGVYVLLAAELGLHLSAVSVPNHVFVRYDDGHDRLNVELLHKGASFADEWYIRNYRIPAASIASGVFLAPLTEREFLAYFYANLGTLYSRVGDLSNSRILYEAALRNAPRLPIAYYNLGNDLLAQNLNRQAVAAFNEALNLFPTDIFSLNNRGIALCRLGKARRARRSFQAAVELDPAFSQARTNLTEMRCGVRKQSIK